MQQKVSRGLYEWEHAEESATLTSMGIRKVFYTHAIAVAARHPVLGVGTGGFKNAYGEQIAGKYDPSDWRSEVASDPHNQYLAIAVPHGLVGLAIFIAWLVAVAKSQAGPPAYRGLALAILCGWCATSLFSSHFRTFAEGHLVTTFLGVLLAQGACGSDGRAPAADPGVVQGEAP
jgi:O-antigen ligase